MATQVGLQKNQDQEIGFVFIARSENIPCDVGNNQKVNLIAKRIISSFAFTESFYEMCYSSQK